MLEHSEVRPRPVAAATCFGRDLEQVVDFLRQARNSVAVDSPTIVKVYQVRACRVSGSAK